MQRCKKGMAGLARPTQIFL